MKSITDIAFLDVDPAQGIHLAWLKCKYNHCVVKLSQLTKETQEQQLLLDKCAQLYQQIQEQEFELWRKQRLSQRISTATTDQ